MLATKEPVSVMYTFYVLKYLKIVYVDKVLCHYFMSILFTSRSQMILTLISSFRVSYQMMVLYFKANALIFNRWHRDSSV